MAVFTEQDKQNMDNAAADAQNALMDMDDLDDATLRELGNWLREWVPKAGYKRLGRILCEFADKKEST